MSKRRRPIVLNVDELNIKGTKELLSYIKKLQQCEESFELSDFIENPDANDDKTIYFKQTNKWKMAYDNVKYVLKNREHIE